MRFGHIDEIAGLLMVCGVEQGMRGLVQADQREAGPEDAECNLVEAQITHGLTVLQSLKKRGPKKSIRARTRGAFLHFSWSPATRESPAK